MNNLISHFLAGQDLNPTDVKVYLDIYKHGQAFASSIAARTEIDRTTVYSSIKRLLKKGIIIQTKVNDIKAYTAVSPEIFVDKLDREIEDLEAQKKTAKSFIDELQKVRKQNFVKPTIRIFEGAEAIMALYEETLSAGKNQKSFVSLSTIPDPLKDFLKQKFITSKIKKGVFSKVIVSDNKMSTKYKSLDRLSNRETKIVQNHPFSLHAEIVLFGGKYVAIVDFHKQIYGIVIESETLYKSIDNIFDLIWNAVN